jgi:hypothetical protein
LLYFQEYKKSIAERDRTSLAGRLDEWRKQRAVESDSEERLQQQEADLYERELKIQAVQDAKNLEDLQKKSKRDSLAYRLDKARKDKTYEEGLEAVSSALEAEERRIAQLDREDVNNYKTQIIETRRQSLQYRYQTQVAKSNLCFEFTV